MKVASGLGNLAISMATRDRTALFLRYREEASALHSGPTTLRSRSHPSSTSPSDTKSLSDSTVKRARTGNQEPGWLFIHKDLVGDIAEIEKTLVRLSALYSKHLLPSFGEGDHAALESDIRVLASELTQMLHGAEGKIRHIGTTSNADDDALVRRNVQKRYATQLQDFSMTFRRKQKEYLSELQGQREAIGANSVAIDFENQNQPGGSRNADLDLQLQRDRKVDNFAAEERSQEIAKIAANINDLASIVKDLATLVVDQGTVLDRVDYNVEEVCTTTKDAVRELRIADRYQRKRHAFWCIVILAIACGILFCMLLLKWLS